MAEHESWFEGVLCPRHAAGIATVYTPLDHRQPCVVCGAMASYLCKIPNGSDPVATVEPPPSEQSEPLPPTRPVRVVLFCSRHWNEVLSGPSSLPDGAVLAGITHQQRAPDAPTCSFCGESAWGIALYYDAPASPELSEPTERDLVPTCPAEPGSIRAFLGDMRAAFGVR